MIEARGEANPVVILLLLVVPLWTACVGTPAPAPPSPEATSDSTAAVPDSVAPSDTIGAPDTMPAVRVDPAIPPDYMPPPGQCRVWRPGEPIEQQVRQQPAGRCSQLRESLAEDDWLIYRPPDASAIVRVWRYDGEGQVVSQRIHDAETGALLRHVAPAGS